MNPIENKETFKPIWGSTNDVMTRICCKRTKLYGLMRDDPTFPKPIRLSQNHIRWNLAEIDQWIADKEAARV
ncbi:hypothetical protein BKG95_00655 [Rodentibacter pneumotropicus]|uniref:AlpA family phage regulatory protein n=1 Tax=Rodentibacter ratti TaxID=1906745 RepID=A0A1V3LEF5_9PAST|nr:MULTISPECIES: AlpA family phage regulatory protein [Rodentibacter]OOF68812.1 hypothetical protein BKG95_00655 [Rodentibacter pneumotropicus]OOF87805.1 hypothetical protein BKG88_00985 [Rodentibacter ratti]OOF88322.1 hypothetical protein BKG94_07260 [Rodentibacter ratti]